MARLYDRFRRLSAGGWYDAEDLAEAAAAMVDAGAAPGFDDLGLIVFYLPHGLSPGEVRLMESLAGRRRCAVILGITGDAVADESTLDLAARLHGKTASPIAPTAAESDTPLRAGSARLHVAPTAHDELRRVIRHIMREVNESDTPLHRMAILYRTADPYASLIRDELRMAGIPMAGPDREPLASAGAGRTLIGLLELCGNQFPRSEVMGWLSSCPSVTRLLGTLPAPRQVSAQPVGRGYQESGHRGRLAAVARPAQRPRAEIGRGCGTAGNRRGDQRVPRPGHEIRGGRSA